MSPKVMDKYSDFRKEMILHASWDCFVEFGYKKTTLRTIAKRMNATTGAIYPYFKSKDELIEALLTYNNEKSKQLIESISKEYSGINAIDKIFTSLFGNISPKYASKMIRGSFEIWSKAMEKNKSKNILSSSWANTQKNIEQYIRQGIERHEISKNINPEIMAGFMVVILLGLQVQIMLSKSRISSNYVNQIKSIAIESMK